jgi:hypothetical protein
MREDRATVMACRAAMPDSNNPCEANTAGCVVWRGVRVWCVYEGGRGVRGRCGDTMEPTPSTHPHSWPWGVGSGGWGVGGRSHHWQDGVHTRCGHMGRHPPVLAGGGRSLTCSSGPTLLLIWLRRNPAGSIIGVPTTWTERTERKDQGQAAHRCT